MSLSGDGQSRRENKTSELKDGFTEIMQTEIKIGKKKKNYRKKEESNQYLQYNLIWYQIPNREERMKKKRKEKKKSEDIMAENIPKQTKERYQLKIQEAQLTLHRINAK